MAQRDDLPLADYDQLALPDLRHRIRSLEEPQLQTLFEHETAHGNRIPVLEFLHARIKELHQGAEPSGGDQANAPGGELDGDRIDGAGEDGRRAEHAAAARRRQPDPGAR